jgi:hypothetical protein
MKYSKGVMWLDDCRIPFLNDEGYNYKNGPLGNSFSVGEIPDGKRTEPVESNPKGRFTPNLLVCDDMLNDGSVSKSQRGRNDVGKPTYTGNSLLNSKTTMNNTDRGFDDKGSSSRYYDLDKWFDNTIDSL